MNSKQYVLLAALCLVAVASQQSEACLDPMGQLRRLDAMYPGRIQEYLNQRQNGLNGLNNQGLQNGLNNGAYNGLNNGLNGYNGLPNGNNLNGFNGRPNYGTNGNNGNNGQYNNGQTIPSNGNQNNQATTST